jgi:4-diphosphocytidyl-2-C-methyl-D-erythritol kinase
MIAFPHIKINLGLHILRKRNDGFHDIETCLYPINWCEALEAVVDKSVAGLKLEFSGIKASDDAANNLVYKAWHLLNVRNPLPGIHAQLHKLLPIGAGLGGGSADGAAMLKLLNTLCELGYNNTMLEEMAAHLGSDCAFFIRNKPCLAEGRGEQLSEVNVVLDEYYILIVHPGIHSDTAAAYAGARPSEPEIPLKKILSMPVARWKALLKNDFEPTIFSLFPEIASLKDSMYAGGALYASMSGSGSAVFGIFENLPPYSLLKGTHFLQKPRAGIL